MGSSFSQEEQDILVSKLFNLAVGEGMLPDIGIDDAMIKYSGLNSSAVLQDYSSELLAEKVPDALKILDTTLGEFNSIPHAVGIGALIISMVLELALASAKKHDSVSDMLQRVFAEEKVSDVRDTMHEYMKRYQMHLWNDEELLADTIRLENQLSNHLTRLRNSLLVDGQMNSQGLKLWVNGAAFHVQMLIHYARIRNAGAPGNTFDLDRYSKTIKSVIQLYLKDLRRLLQTYKTYKTSTISLKVETGLGGRFTPFCIVTDSETGRYSYVGHVLIGFEQDISSSFLYNHCESSLDAYINYMFNSEKITRLEKYFINADNLFYILTTQQFFLTLTA